MFFLCVIKQDEVEFVADDDFEESDVSDLEVNTRF